MELTATAGVDGRPGHDAGATEQVMEMDMELQLKISPRE